MIKAALTFHDPLEVYDYFKNAYGSIYMLISQNYACIRFDNIHAAQQILSRPKTIMVKGLPLKVYPADYKQPQRKNDPKLTNQIDNLSLESNMKMDLQNTDSLQSQSLVEQKTILMNNVNVKMKKIGVVYDAKIKQIIQTYPDQQVRKTKIDQFNRFFQSQLKRNKKVLLGPFNTLINNIKQFSRNSAEQVIDLEPQLHSIQTLPNNQKKQIISPNFIEQWVYTSSQNVQVKRLCALNEEDFICTQKIPSKTQNKGQLKIYGRKQNVPKYCVDIQQGPYSLLCLDNFILSGDYAGHIHFIDIFQENLIEYSNKLNAGLVYEMQRYSNIGQNYSILTVLLGLRNEYKIKIFEVEKQKISEGINSLTFHPRQEIRCEGVTMTMQTLGNGKFVYGSEKNTYFCPSFDLSQRQYIIHEERIMKIKKFNSNVLLEATQRKIGLTDLRTLKFKQDMFSFNFQLNTLELISDNLVFYGGRGGQIGVIDCRKPQEFLWTPKEQIHSGKISDILKIGNRVVTCDSKGIICDWTNVVM